MLVVTTLTLKVLPAATTWSLGVYDDECIEGPDPERIVPSNQVLAWQAFPNPANDLVSLTLPDNHHWETLVLQNVLGREILRVQLADGQRTTTLRTVSLAPGYLSAPLGEKEQALKIIVRR